MSEDNVDSNGYPRPEILGPSVHDFETSVKRAKVCPDVSRKKSQKCHYLVVFWSWFPIPITEVVLGLLSE